MLERIHWSDLLYVDIFLYMFYSFKLFVNELHYGALSYLNCLNGYVFIKFIMCCNMHVSFQLGAGESELEGHRMFAGNVSFSRGVKYFVIHHVCVRFNLTNLTGEYNSTRALRKRGKGGV